MNLMFMRSRRFIYFLLCLLCLAGALFLWQHGGRSPARGKITAPSAVATRAAPTVPTVTSQGAVNTNAAQISSLGRRHIPRRRACLRGRGGPDDWAAVIGMILTAMRCGLPDAAPGVKRAPN